MQSTDARYSVVLRTAIPPEERQLLEQLCCPIPTPSGGALLELLCTRIDLSHPVYVELETFRPGDDVARLVRIPHHFVLLISGDETEAPIGFASRS